MTGIAPLFSADHQRGTGPLYLQLHRQIADAIRRGDLAPGASLPPEREMAAMAGLSRVTVRKAVEGLVQEGLVIQKRGSGTFVAPRVERMEQVLSVLTSLTEDMTRRGREVRSLWLSRCLDDPAPEECARLGLDTRSRVARLERVRISEGLPLAVEHTAIPAAFLPDPTQVDGSLYAVLGKAGLRPVRAVQRISAESVGPAEAGLLQVAPGSAGLRIERIAWLSSGQAVEFTRSLYRGDAYDFAVDLKLSTERDET